MHCKHDSKEQHDPWGFLLVIQFDHLFGHVSRDGHIRLAPDTLAEPAEPDSNRAVKDGHKDSEGKEDDTYDWHFIHFISFPQRLH